jgi:geranylgeranyl pyrophosphate synthase
MLHSGAVILIGDYLFAQSAMLAAATNSTRVVSIFASTLGDICDGQLREMFDGHRLDQTREQYERRTYGKTASLFAGAAAMGAVIGAAPEHHISALREYGSHLGMAFQIVDDVLDLTEGTQELGKPAGNDLRQGMITLPTMLYAADLEPDGPAYRQLTAIADGEERSEEAVDQVVSAIRNSGAIDRAIDVAEQYVRRAKECLSVVPDAETHELLASVADFALHRVS